MFFTSNTVLNMSDGINQMGSFQNHLVICLAISWVIIFICLLGGAKILGKISYFTALFPYVVITALVIYGAMMEGAGEGILHLHLPSLQVKVSCTILSLIFLHLNRWMSGLMLPHRYSSHFHFVMVA